MSLHKYLYANANPVNLADPSGNYPGVISVVFAIAFIALIFALSIYRLYYEGTDEFIVRRAIRNAEGLVDNAIAKMRRWSPSDQAEYIKWFGTPTRGRRSTVLNVFLLSRTALQGEITWHRTTTAEFAHVVPRGRLEVWLGTLFWSAPAEGTDSQAGVFVHEMSHEVWNTNDYFYGTINAKRLAVSNPTRAIDNADNYEYFAEVAP